MNQQINRFLQPKKIKLQEDNPLIERNFLEIQINEKKVKEQQMINIKGTDVYFPFEPYSVQKDYISHVIEALNTKQNALLQSPTGTGKTLSLLCATLGWLKKHKYDNFTQNIEDQEPKSCLKIIYASRTHTQLKQVLKELKRTVYMPKVALLGSRDQLCIKPEVNKYKGSALNQECKRAVKTQQCQYYNKDNFNYLSFEHSQEVMDIEELKTFGTRNRCCPYYLERLRKDNADIILLPYNYLLEKDFTSIVSLENSIVIFDEAHNVQSVAEDGSSFSISQTYVVEAEKELERWIDQIEATTILLDVLQVKLAKFHLSHELKEYRRIVITLKHFGQYMESLKSDKRFKEFTDQTDKTIIMDGREIFDIIFKHSKDSDNVFRLNGAAGNSYADGITMKNIKEYVDHCAILIELMNEQASTPGWHFELWVGFIRSVMNLLSSDKDAKSNTESIINPINTFKLSIQFDTSNDSLSLKMLCLDPGQAFQKLFQKDIHSLILTSGTLSPFDSWEFELRLPFKVQLQNNHIIDLERNVLAHVSIGQTFNWSYQNRNDQNQIGVLGMLILNLSRVIPNGMLVVMASYSLMNKIRKEWTYSKMLNRINELKRCFWEPQDSIEMVSVFQEYAVNAKKKGAIMFAVQRGKVSEGIDFSDELCRAVFLVGVPFPPLVDKKIIEKKNFIDKIFKSPEFASATKINSSQWYTQQAIRSTNQAIGRVIRHVNDYGAVYLCDARFDQGEIKKGISNWIQPAIKPWPQIEELIKKSAQFFQRDSLNTIVDLKVFEEENQYIQNNNKRKPVAFYGLNHKDMIQQIHQVKEELEQKQKQLDYQIEQDNKISQDQILLQVSIQQQQQQQQDLQQKNKQASTQTVVQPMNQQLQQSENQSKKKLVIKLRNQNVN